VAGGELDRARIEEIVTAVADRLEGRWLLVGGAFVALTYEPDRVTEDVDLVGMEGTQGERYALLDLAFDLGLPVEAVNSAADFFVRRIEGWADEVEVLRVGARATVYKPTSTLFLLLKVARMSERDLRDCEALLARGGPFDRDRVLAALDTLPTGDDDLRDQRRARLREIVGTQGRA